MSSRRLRLLVCWLLIGCSRSTLFPLDDGAAEGGGVPGASTESQPGAGRGASGGAGALGGRSAGGRGGGGGFDQVVVGPNAGSSGSGGGAPALARPGTGPAACNAGDSRYCMCPDAMTLGIASCQLDASGRGTFGACGQCATVAPTCTFLPGLQLYGDCGRVLCDCNPRASNCDTACWEDFFNQLRDYVGCVGHNCAGANTSCVDAMCSPYFGEVAQATHSMICARELTDACVAPALAQSCGDGVRDFGELCDGSDLGGSSCPAFGFASGTLRCAPDCTYDTRGCFDPR